jgi:hydrogenase maturation factor
VPEVIIQRAKNFLFEPGISVVRDAHIAIGAGRIHAMHDPTEGGLAMAVHELATAARVGIVIEGNQIPILEEAARLCGLWPQPTRDIARVPCSSRRQLKEARIRIGAHNTHYAAIGRIVPPSEGSIQQCAQPF